MRVSIQYLFDIIASIPKTIYFNFKCLPIKKAIKFPFYIHYRTRIHLHKSNVSISPESKITPFMIKFGNMGSFGVVENRYNSFFVEHGTVLFKGKAAFGIGSSLRSEGNLVFGSGFNANRNTFISCTEKVVFGDDCLLGWNISVRDSDGHIMYENGSPQNSVSPVTIGNRVWICAHVHILKGVVIGDNSVIAYKSLVTKKYPLSNCLIGGSIAKVLKNNIDWRA